VTHDMGTVNRFCHRALLLERGEMIAIGEPKDIAARYLELNFPPETGTDGDDETVGERPGDHHARIVEAWIEDEHGERAETCMQGRTYRFSTRVEFVREVVDPAYTMLFLNDQWQDVLVATTAFDQERPGRFAAGESAVFSVELQCVLGPGRYQPAAIVAHRGSGDDIIDRWDRVLSFVVVGPYATGGLVDVPYQATIERGARAEVT
jgi:hypothetical protein